MSILSAFNTLQNLFSGQIGGRYGQWVQHSIGFATGFIPTQAAVPYTRVIGQAFDRFVPSHLPSYDQLTRLFYQGFLTEDELADWLLSLGIRIHGTMEGSRARRELWHNVVKSGRPTFPLDVMYKAWCLDDAQEEKLKYEFKRHGFKSPDQFKLFSTDSHPLSVDTILELNTRGIIHDNEIDKYLRHAGYANATLAGFLKQQSNGIDTKLALDLMNRGVISLDGVIQFQKWNGTRDNIVQMWEREQRWQWPNLGQIVNWGQRLAFDGEYADRLQLDSEKPDGYNDFGRALGQHWKLDDTPPQGWPIPTLSNADLAWRAHWTPNDLASAIMMLHRLRPTGGVNGGQRVPNVKPYTDADLDADLKAMAIPPGRREQVKAITYSLPRYTYFKRAFAQNLVTKDELAERFKDNGFSPDTAKLLADSAEHELIQSQVDRLRPVTLAQIKEAYRIGTITRTQAASGLYLLYLGDYAQVQRYLSLPADAQIGEVAGNPFVNQALTSIDADVAGELAKQAIKIIENAYKRLEITAQQTLSQLVQLGIVTTRAQQYVTLWTYEKAVEGVEASAGQLRDWYIHGLINQATYQARLSILGYGPGDSATMVARANLDISDRAAKMQAQTVRAALTQQRQLAAAAKALAAQQKDISKRMCSSATRNQLVTFAVKGYITYVDALQRLTQCGMDGKDAVDLLASRQPKKGGLTLEQVEEKSGYKPSTNGTAKPS